jgi:hypothetical protein
MREYAQVAWMTEFSAPTGMRHRLKVNPGWDGQSHPKTPAKQASPGEGGAMYIGIGTIVLIVIIVLVILMLRRR